VPTPGELWKEIKDPNGVFPECKDPGVQDALSKKIKSVGKTSSWKRFVLREKLCVERVDG
jgi:hypothetical protein